MRSLELYCTSPLANMRGEKAKSDRARSTVVVKLPTGSVTAFTDTLGSTDHRVPRWLSEGLSVWEEHHARTGWGASMSPAFLDAYRQGKLVPVSRMNDGFTRPTYPEQVGHSYYQASLVCDLIVKQWGEQALVALLAEHRAGRTTDEAFLKVTGLSMAAFDKRFDEYMREQIGRAHV